MTPNLNRPLAASSPMFRLLGWQSIALISVVGLLGGPAVVAQGVSPSELGGNPSAGAPAGPGPATPVDTVPDTMTLAPDALPASPAAARADRAPALESNETFIDATQYTVGATERSGDRPMGLAIPGMAGTPLLGGDGDIRTGRTTASDQTYAVSPPNVQYFYNRTLRPPGRLGNGNLHLIFPLAIPAPITSAFGWRFHPIAGDQRFHAGTDLGAPMGTPVLAAYAGRVAIADFMGGYGLAVTLDHNQGTQQTLYGHLSEIFVKPGDPVQQGDVIGRVGSTGNSTGPHLHFEFHQLTSEGWLALDPGAQLEYSLAQFMNALQIGKAGTAIGSFNVGLTGNTERPTPSLTAPGMAIAVPLFPPNALPTVMVPKTVVPKTVASGGGPAQPVLRPILSNQQLSFRESLPANPL